MKIIEIVKPGLYGTYRSEIVGWNDPILYSLYWFRKTKHNVRLWFVGLKLRWQLRHFPHPIEVSKASVKGWKERLADESAEWLKANGFTVPGKSFDRYHSHLRDDLIIAKRRYLEHELKIIQ